MKKIHKAFTLIEMVIVLFIISLLLLIMIPNLMTEKNKADERSNEAFVSMINTQREIYAENNPEEVPTLKQLADHGYISVKQYEKAQSLKIPETAAEKN